uniref:VRR-NUC domain-containing protein n=1 Tax=viral metagenome TaxID=1070528 RepID=A0A6M3M2H9_9ZZZZ
MRSKYHAVRTSYGGRLYDSKLEARFAQILDIARCAEDPAQRVVWVAEKVKFTFPWGDSHKPDFIVGKADGSVCFIEVKGYKTRDGEKNRRILEYFLGHAITVWRG